MSQTYVYTGEYYNSGEYHGAWDLPVPIGTPVHAVRDGTIRACWDHVPNDEDQPGDTDYSGEPSNWILQWVTMNGSPFSVYYQHLSPGLRVHAGLKVSGGDVIAHSGDSGNTSGPHLHIHVMRGHQSNRYQLYNDRSVAVYPPSKLWADAKPPEEKFFMSTQDDINKLLNTKIYGDDADKEDKDVTFRQALREAHELHRWAQNDRQRQRDNR
jgi:murein DD-endopeptidase MepM/ murein hydrolase activator NlpD